jgi:hypothetical protein
VRLASWFGPFRHFVLAARIKCVTPQRVEYFDEAGQECFVDLDECARNWRLRNEDEDDFDLLTSEDSAARRKPRYVGGRGLLEYPPWIEFANKSRTRFEFEPLNEGYGLIIPLKKVRCSLAYA